MLTLPVVSLSRVWERFALKHWPSSLQGPITVILVERRIEIFFFDVIGTKGPEHLANGEAVVTSM